MLGLINRSIQCFVRDYHGPETWDRVVDRARSPVTDFEAMLQYDDALTEELIGATAAILDIPRETLLEDLGAHLVADPHRQTVRRLLRFGGETYQNFLLSLDDLPERARLAVPELDMPELRVHEFTDTNFAVECRFAIPGFGWVLMGLLRAMADDYGALVTLDHAEFRGGGRVRINLVEADFAEGRGFALGDGPAFRESRR